MEPVAAVPNGKINFQERLGQVGSLDPSAGLANVSATTFFLCGTRTQQQTTTLSFSIGGICAIEKLRGKNVKRTNTWSAHD